MFSRKQVKRLTRNSVPTWAHTYETLELKRMLAGVDLGSFPKHPLPPSGGLVDTTADAFSKDAVTYKEMATRAANHTYAKNELIVAIKTSEKVATAGLAQLNWSNLTGDSGAKVIQTLSHTQRANNERVTLVHLKLTGKTDMWSVMKTLDARDEVMWSSPNFTYKGDPREYAPNDPQYPSQWHHDKMQNNLAWDVTTGSTSIIVAVTDDGTEINHEDLFDNLWRNDDFPLDGEDNDGNGYIDDERGWDFHSNNNDTNPNGIAYTHGTHVAGILGARMNNALGVTGVAGTTTIMPLQIYGPNGWTSAMVAGAFTYATDNGAKIVNTSYNIDDFVNDPVFLAGLQYLYDGGVLHFNSAGNNGQLNPARQALTQTLLVASTDQSDAKSNFSNFGVGIDFAAPGDPILSTLVGNSYGQQSGTSMAAPAVAGAAALIWSANPDWTREQVVAQLYPTADNIDAQNPGYQGLLGAGRVNTFRGVTETIGAPKVRLVNNLPANGGSLNNLGINNFDLAFDQIMAPDAMNDIANFELRGAGPDRTLDTADDVIYTLSSDMYRIGTNLLNFQIGEGSLGYGDYRLTIRSGGVSNPFGTALDGDADGSEGGDHVSEFTIAPSDAGEVFFSQDRYQPYELIKFMVADANASDPVVVVVTTSGGDSETVTLSDNGDLSWSGTLASSDGAQVVDNGTLEVLVGQTITVTYQDQDNGDGEVVDVSDTARISKSARYKSQDTPIFIGDFSMIYSTITISDPGLIGDLNVEINITHTYVSDLEVFLTAPDGTRIPMFQNIGEDGINFTETVLDDEAVDLFEDGTAPFTGSFRPAQPLSTFDLMRIAGDWKLEVRDEYPGDTGTLDEWEMFIDIVSFDTGTLSIDKAEYGKSDTVEITVRDSNHTGPMTVEVVTSGGDTETVTLTPAGAYTYKGTIDTVPGTADVGNGQLDVAPRQQFTVTYYDADIGNGSPGQTEVSAIVTNITEYPSSDVPVNILDNTTVISTIEITDEGIVRDLDVALDITHTWDADLDVFLTSPDGTRVELFSGVGGSDDNFEQTRLDDEAAESIMNGVAPFTGSYRPMGRLSDLDGLEITGTWTLEITDNFGGDIGTLNAWSLFIDVGSIGQGSLFLDRDGYNIGETVNITVIDGNHTGPMTVEVQTDGGDTETVSLSQVGPRTFAGTINLAEGGPVDGNGQLDVFVAQNFTVKYVDLDDGSGNTNEVTKSARVMNRIEFPSSDIPVDIIDNDTVFSTLEITETGTIADLDLSLDITHTWDSDLIVELFAPDGTRVELFAFVGGDGDDFSGTYLDDEAGTSIADGSAPFSGAYRPTDSLSVFDGMSITGTWTLAITDTFDGDQGSLNAWSLWIDVIPEIIVPDIDIFGPGTVTEGDNGSQDIAFTVMLSEPTTREVTVEYSTTNAYYSVPATPDDDFSRISGTLVFAPGEMSKEVIVSIPGNRVAELDESFGLELFNPSNGNLLGSLADVEIIDNDLWTYDQWIDFGTDTSPVAGGQVGVGLLPYTASRGLGWTDLSNVEIVDRVLGAAGVRDIALTSAGSFAFDVPNGPVIVRVNFGDQTTSHEQMRVKTEGIARPVVSTVAGQVITRIYTVNVTDGQLNLDFEDMGGADPHVAISGIGFGRR
jgi:subtilisin-like proprotein convertase family protein/subtilisin family serine protease